jgi:hypothetical protein
MLIRREWRGKKLRPGRSPSTLRSHDLR